MDTKKVPGNIRNGRSTKPMILVFRRAAWVAAGGLVLASNALGVGGCSSSAGVPPPAPGSSCAQDSSVPCDRATGFSCAPGDNPENADSSLVCSVGAAAPGATLFCCVSVSTSSCIQDNSVVGCTGFSIGFSCTGTDTPDQANSALVCSSPTPGNGVLLYCCTD